MVQGNTQQHDAVSGKFKALSESHIAVLDEAVAAFALQCNLIIWHSTRGRDVPNGKLLTTAHGDQGVIIERIGGDLQIAALHWLTPILPHRICCRVKQGTAMLVVLTSCGVLYLYNTRGQKLYMQTLSVSNIAVNVTATVLSTRALAIKSTTAIISIPAAEFARVAEKFCHPNDMGRPGVGRHAHGCLRVHTIHMPKQLVRQSVGVCLKANVSVLEELLEYGTNGSEDTKVLSIGEGPAISWLSCGYDLTRDSHNHQGGEDLSHRGNHQLGDMSKAQRILDVVCRPQSLLAAFPKLRPAAADLVGLIAGLSCLHCHHP